MTTAVSGSARAVVVTAATTPMGRAVVEQLRASVRVVCVRTANEPVPRTAPESNCDALQHLVVDLDRSRDVRSMLFGVAREVGVDTIVYLASRPNVRALRNVLDAAEAQPDVHALVVQSSAGVYRIDSGGPNLIDEDHPLDFSPHAIRRAALEADVLVSARIGVSRLKLAVLRLTDVIAPGLAGPLLSYLSAPVCLRPLGYDPMLNLLSIDDAARSLSLAALHQARGIFNVRGVDTLPLSELIHRTGRVGLALPGPTLSLVGALIGSDVDYATMGHRLHYSGILDGRAADTAFGYAPQHPIALEHVLTHALRFAAS